MDEDLVNDELSASEEGGAAEGATGAKRHDGVRGDEAVIDSRPEVDRPDPADTKEIVPGGVIDGETASPGTDDMIGSDVEDFPGDAPSGQAGGADD